MSWVDDKRSRNLRDGYPEDKGLRDGRCNRSGCLSHLQCRPQFYMRDHETYTEGERLYYCAPCAEAFSRADRELGIVPERCSLDEDTL